MHTISQIAYYTILGKPLIMYLGIITLLSFLFTASIPIMRMKGINKIPFSWHKRFAFISISLAIIHGILGLASYF